MIYKTFRSQKVSEYDQEIPQSQTTDRPYAPLGRTTEHLQQQDIQKTIKIQATGSLFIVVMIAKLERTQSNAY